MKCDISFLRWFSLLDDLDWQQIQDGISLLDLKTWFFPDNRAPTWQNEWHLEFSPLLHQLQLQNFWRFHLSSDWNHSIREVCYHMLNLLRARKLSWINVFNRLYKLFYKHFYTYMYKLYDIIYSVTYGNFLNSVVSSVTMKNDKPYAVLNWI